MTTPQRQVYSASTINRKRRVERRQHQGRDRAARHAKSYDVLREDHPQSVRHVFYRMTDPRLEEPVEKSDHGYRHVQDRLKKLRRAGRIT